MVETLKKILICDDHPITHTDPSCPTFVNGDMGLPVTSSVLSGTAPDGWTAANYSTGFFGTL